MHLPRYMRDLSLSDSCFRTEEDGSSLSVFVNESCDFLRCAEAEISDQSHRASLNLRLTFGLDFALCLISESVTPLPTSSPLTFCSLLRRRAFSSILICFSIDSRSFLFVRRSPSSFPIRAFISALSICQAFRSRSCLCHSVCRKRITPARFNCQPIPSLRMQRWTPGAIHGKLGGVAVACSPWSVYSVPWGWPPFPPTSLLPAALPPFPGPMPIEFCHAMEQPWACSNDHAVPPFKPPLLARDEISLIFQLYSSLRLAS